MCFFSIKKLRQHRVSQSQAPSKNFCRFYSLPRNNKVNKVNLRERCSKLLETEDKSNKVFKNGSSKICGRQLFKKIEGVRSA